MKKLCLWSGPRNISSALMYSFAQREDTKVVDEPLYGHYLLRTGVKHPGREEIMSAVNCDGNLVMENFLKLKDSNGKKILFLKQMTKHLVDLDHSFLPKFGNILLIRNPKDMLQSLRENIPEPNLADTGLDLQWQLFKKLENIGNKPIVIDADELLKDPRDILTQLCHHLKLKFFDSMLSWPAKPREEDGVWARYWYQSLHKSTGFLPYSPKANFPLELDKLLAECEPYYKKLLTKSIRRSDKKL